MNSVQLKDIVFSKNTPIIDCKFTPLFFDIFGGVLVSTGLFDLSAACGGFLAYLLNHPGNNLKCRLRLRCCRLIDGSYLLMGVFTACFWDIIKSKLLQLCAW